ncbi:MAG: hypothetical protein CND86_02730 [Bacteroidetes bacterium MED-G21]|nr:MAG: hypothetical protein CND86_02730 [Bacteroidetes bacterium MED-G21]
MKKLSLFLLGFVATGFMASAQISSDMFSQPANTGANMTVGVNASKFDQFEGGQIGAFYDLDGDGTLECVGLESIGIGFFGLALWGDDSSTPEADGLGSGAVPQFALLHDGNVLLVDEIPQFTGYVTNGIVNITDASIDGGSGCTDGNACNAMSMYSDVNYSDDGSCSFPDAGYDCDGACLADGDGDGVCDEFEVAGCQDGSACNFNAAATDSDGSCSYPDAGYDCAGNCLADADGDGICNEFEVVGCQDAAYDNYDASATDAGDCLGLLGCTDDGYFEYDAAAEVDDGSCASLIIPGCTNPAASNYDPAANLNIAEGEDGACLIEGVNFTPAADEANTSIVVTSNNMSVLFPVNNAGLWNVDQSNIQVGDIIAAVYETGRLENDFLGYSEISGLANAGSGIWDGDQIGVAVFGADNMINNGFAPGENLKWLVSREGTVYNASVTYATPAYNGTYQEGTYVTVNSVVLGAPADEGCTNPNYMEYNPLATVDDGSCATFISVGCLDANFVNYAGADVDADAIHDNSENFGDAFGQNYTIDLTTGVESPSGVGAIFHDVDVCQSEVPGCTYPYAHNYDDAATEDDGSCDWSAYSYHTFDAVTGENTGTLYSFGGDDDDSNNEWVGSYFEYANDLYQDARMGTGHIVTDLIASYDAYTERRKADSTFLSDTLNDVADWFAADEAADALELADSLSDNYARFDAMFNHLSDSIQFTLDSAATAFALDEAADAQELADTMADNYARFDAMFNHLSDSIQFTLDSANQAHLDYSAARDLELADTMNDMQARYDANDLAHRILEGLITDSLNHHRAPIIIDLHSGWNTVAYYLHHESPVVAQFENQFGSEAAVQANINIVKNNEGLFYWPDFLFDGLGMLEPGQGYQVRVKDATSGKSDFYFEHGIGANEYRVLTPTVPAWAIEMEVENHPNDVRTLVRVVNMLGQEVVPSNQFTGEVLLYMYNDGTVEKKMVE